MHNAELRDKYHTRNGGRPAPRPEVGPATHPSGGRVDPLAGMTTPPCAEVVEPWPRDAQGNRRPVRGVVSTPTLPADVPGSCTPLDREFRRLEEATPGGALPRHYWDLHVRAALQRVDRQMSVEWRRIMRETEEAQRLRHAYDARVSQLRTAYVSRTSRLEAELAKACFVRQAARQTATQAYAAIGATFDPESPDPYSVIRDPKKPVTWRADEAKRLHQFAGSIRLNPLFRGVCTLGIGALTGVSIGILSGVVEPDTLGEQWPAALACAAVGVVPAALIKHSLCSIAFLAARDIRLQLPSGRAFGLLAIGSALLLAVGDITVAGHGIMAATALHQPLTALADPGSPPVTPPTDWTMLLAAPLILSLGFVLSALAEGWEKGWLAGTILNLGDYNDAPSPAAMMAVRTALARVRCAEAEVSRLQGALSELKAQFEAEIEVLSEPPPLKYSLDEPARQRVQDAVAQAREAVREFQHLYSQFVPLPGAAGIADVPGFGRTPAAARRQGAGPWARVRDTLVKLLAWRPCCRRRPK